MTADFLVLQHEPPEGLGRIGPLLTDRGCTPRVIRRDLGESLPDDALKELTGLIVLGGSAGVGGLDERPDLAQELTLVSAALSQNVPTLGICLGSQLMAHALGARIEKGPWELGWRPVAVRTDMPGPLAGLSDTVPALHWHRDRFSAPVDATILASTASTPNQAFSLGPHLGLLFHLEADRAQVEAMSNHLARDLMESGLTPEQLLKDTLQHDATAQTAAAMAFGQWIDTAIAQSAGPRN